jgi:hypothetical protein
MVAHRVKKFATFYKTQRFSTVHVSSPLFLILSKIKTFKILTPYFLRSILILSPYVSYGFPLGISTKLLCLSRVTLSHMSPLSHCSSFFILTLFAGE